MKTLKSVCVCTFAQIFFNALEIQALVVQKGPRATTIASDLRASTSDTQASDGSVSRRDTFHLALYGTTTFGLLGNAAKAKADGGYQPAKRPTAYRVDSTQPPTLIPIESARKQLGVLSGIGKGSGTDKSPVIEEKVNLNNMMKKFVFGTIDAVSDIIGPNKGEGNSGPGYASFLCLGVPAETSTEDINLAESLLGAVLQKRQGETAIGFWFCPLGSQDDLDSYIKSGNESLLFASLKDKGVSESTLSLYLPLFRKARGESLKILALAPELEDITAARSSGLQNVNPERRGSYVADTDGFIALSQDPKFRVYSERSLLKDFAPLNTNDQVGNFFSERILAHESAATAAAKYAYDKPDSLVVIVAPTPDLRFLQGINGRIPRVYRFLNPEINKVTDNAVTTILLNPTAKETLSKSRFLRLEIGTGPDTLAYQSKVSDYLWFSSSPKVNMIPRLMNG